VAPPERAAAIPQIGGEYIRSGHATVKFDCRRRGGRLEKTAQSADDGDLV